MIKNSGSPYWQPPSQIVGWGGAGWCVGLQTASTAGGSNWSVHLSVCPVSQPPLGLCVVTLTLPRDWFGDQRTNQSNQDLDNWHRNIHLRRRVQKRERQRGGHHHANFVNHQRATSPSLRWGLKVKANSLGMDYYMNAKYAQFLGMFGV